MSELLILGQVLFLGTTLEPSLLRNCRLLTDWTDGARIPIRSSWSHCCWTRLRWLLWCGYRHSIPVVQHTCQNVLSVLKPFGHLCIVAVQSLAQGHDRSLSLFIHVGYLSAFRVKQDLRPVFEVHLHDLVAQAEHGCMVCFHPLFNIDRAWFNWLLP